MATCKHCGTKIIRVPHWNGWYAESAGDTATLGSGGVCPVAYHHEPDQPPCICLDQDITKGNHPDCFWHGGRRP